MDTITTLFLIGSSSNLQVPKTCGTSRTCSNYGYICPFTLEFLPLSVFSFGATCPYWLKKKSKKRSLSGHTGSQVIDRCPLGYLFIEREETRVLVGSRQIDSDPTLTVARTGVADQDQIYLAAKLVPSGRDSDAGTYPVVQKVFITVPTKHCIALYEPRQANLCLRAFRHDKF